MNVVNASQFYLYSLQLILMCLQRLEEEFIKEEFLLFFKYRKHLTQLLSF